VCWSARFQPPVEVPGGKPLKTLADARKFLLRLPQSERQSELAQIVIEALLMAAIGTGPLHHAQLSMIELIHRRPASQPPPKKER
jgi:hypothetical protein